MVVAVESRSIAGPDGGQLGLRLYRGGTGSQAPLVVYAHGGGFVTGNLDTDHAHCVGLARAAGCLLVSVDYRLAPEHPCPAALDDVEAALRYAVDNCADLDADAGRIAVMGRDAGAALVAGLAQRMFDEEGPSILVQILHQPMLDSDATPSRREFQRTPGLNGPAVSRAWSHYLGHATASGQHVPAQRANLEGLPPTFVSLLRDRSLPRRSHRLCEQAPACLRSHRIATSSQPHSTASIRWFPIGLSPRKTGHCTRSRCAAYSPCSGCVYTGVNLVISQLPPTRDMRTSTLLTATTVGGCLWSW